MTKSSMTGELQPSDTGDVNNYNRRFKSQALIDIESKIASFRNGIPELSRMRLDSREEKSIQGRRETAHRSIAVDSVGNNMHNMRNNQHAEEAYANGTNLRSQYMICSVQR